MRSWVAGLIMAAAVLAVAGCAAAKGEGFAIYLTKGDIPPARMPALSHVDLAEQPLIALNDIVTYDQRTHEMELTSGAYDRVVSLQVPVTGKSFVVCVDKKPIYWGAFWVQLSSASFDGVTIVKPLSPREEKVLKLELGYPSRSFYTGKDPRLNPEVMKSLEQAGKLK